MRLLLAAASVFIVATAGAGSNYTVVNTLPDISNHKSNESLNNNIALGNNHFIPTTTTTTHAILINDDYRISYGIEDTTHNNNNNNNSQSNKNSNGREGGQLSTNSFLEHSECNENHKSVTFGESTDNERVGEIFTSSNNSSHSNESNNSSSASPATAVKKQFKTLQRHQRAIAAMTEQKGLLGRQLDDGEHILRRGKRYLQFAKGSRVSWRTTGKNNILRVNTLWAYGYGFRANFPFPGPEESRRPFFKRDVLHSLADILDGHGLDGRACILKSYCTAVLDVDSSISGGMLFKMLKLIFTLHENEKRHFPYLRLDNCRQILHSHCPLGFDSISPHTDDV
ncbi:uncharacterized protein [Eurosta solidaginis]|uniref:uncharacterized protein n=1 Tax=Eurosta solidaginis TaxID=178769 RepID=UPI0035312810